MNAAVSGRACRRGKSAPDDGFPGLGFPGLGFSWLASGLRMRGAAASMSRHVWMEGARLGELARRYAHQSTHVSRRGGSDARNPASRRDLAHRHCGFAGRRRRRHVRRGGGFTYWCTGSPVARRTEDLGMRRNSGPATAAISVRREGRWGRCAFDIGEYALESAAMVPRTSGTARATSLAASGRRQAFAIDSAGGATRYRTPAFSGPSRCARSAGRA